MKYEYARTVVYDAGMAYPDWDKIPPPDGDGWRLHSVTEGETWIAYYWEREVQE